MYQRDADYVAALTPQNPFDRLADGRPNVPDDLLERLKLVTNDEAYGILERQNGYKYQFEGNWYNLHPDRVVVGRAVTARFVPLRPDLQGVIQGYGEGLGLAGGHNSWVIDKLQPGDVLIVDLFGKVRDGTFIGDNLGTAIAARTGTGVIIDGGIRDLMRVREIDGFNVFCRGVDPSAIYEVTLVEVNGPVRIGSATVMPGDAVLGTREGVTFIPPHLVQVIVERSEDVRVRDVFGKSRIAEGVYTSGQIDVNVWADHIEADYLEWAKAQLQQK